MPHSLRAAPVALVLLLSLAPAGALEAQRTPEQARAALRAADESDEPFPRNVLSSVFGFEARHLDRLDRGDVVLGEALFSDGDEVAVVGAVRVTGDRETFVRTMHPSWRFRNPTGDTQMGVFSSPPRVSDLDAVRMDPSMVDDIRKCRPGDCDVQMSRTGMEFVRQGIDWNAPGHELEVEARAKEFLVRYLNEYIENGFGGTQPFEDSRNPIDRVSEFRELMGHAMLQAEQEPLLHRYLDAYPRAQRDGIDDTFYWVMSPGVGGVAHPTFMMIHGVTWTDPNDPTRVSMADKLLYASHYAVASLGESIIVEDRERSDSFYVVRLQRVRFHVGGGLAHGIIMNRVQSGMRSSLEDELEMIRRVAARDQEQQDRH